MNEGKKERKDARHWAEEIEATTQERRTTTTKTQGEQKDQGAGNQKQQQYTRSRHPLSRGLNSCVTLFPSNKTKQTNQTKKEKLTIPHDRVKLEENAALLQHRCV